MKTLEKTIANLIQSQFPDLYKTDGPTLIAFLEAYYEWLEQTGNPLYYSRRIMEIQDIDQTLDEFVSHFKATYLQGIQFETATDQKLLVKRVLDLYRSKGTIRAVRLLFQLVFGLDVSVYYPSQDVFKLSDGTWTIPQYLEVQYDTRNSEVAGHSVTGVTTGATAFCDRFVRRVVNGRYVDILYVSAGTGTFRPGELLSVDSVTYRPVLLGSLGLLTVVSGGQDFAVGDQVGLPAVSGNGGIAQVTGINQVSGVVAFNLVDGGWGYTPNSQVLVSNTVISLANVQSARAPYWSAFQKWEKVTITGGGTVTANVMGISSNVTLHISGSPTFTTGETVSSAGGGYGKVLKQSGNTLYLGNVVHGWFPPGTPVLGLTSGVTSPVVSVDTTIGVYGLSNTVNSSFTAITGNGSGTTATITGFSSGTASGFGIGAVSNTETTYLNPDYLANNSVNAVPFMSILLNANTFGFTAFPSGNVGNMIDQLLTFTPDTLGLVQSITGLNPGTGYSQAPFVSVYEPLIGAAEKRDYCITLDTAHTGIQVGERVQQVVTNTQLALVSTATATSYKFDEPVYQANSTANVGTGLVSAISAGTLLVWVQNGAFNTSNVLHGLYSLTNSTPSAVTTANVTQTALGQVKAQSGNTLYVRRLSVAQDFVGNTSYVLTGLTSSATSNIVGSAQDANTLPAGDNAVISANSGGANGQVTSFLVVDSGFGYANSEVFPFVSEDGSRSGTVQSGIVGLGHARGYYSGTKGFLSEDKYVTDGLYYQPFSYEIQGAIDVSRYADMVKAVVHVSSTKLFGRFILSSENPRSGSVQTDTLITVS